MSEKFPLPPSFSRRQDERVRRGQTAVIERFGSHALYTSAERRLIAELPESEARFIHEIKVEFDATLREEASSGDPQAVPGLRDTQQQFPLPSARHGLPRDD